MARILIAAFLLICGCIPLFAQSVAPGYAQAKTAGRATLVLRYIETPGFVEKAPDGTYKGVCVEIMHDFAAYMLEQQGIEITYRFDDADAGNFISFLENIKTSSGGVFGLGNISITPERQKNYSFSPPIINNVAILMSNKELPTLRSFQQLPSTFSGLTAYAVANSTNAKRLYDLRDAYYPSMRIVEVPSSPEALKRINSDPNSFTSLDFTYYLQGRLNGLPLKRHPIGDDPSGSFGIIMPQNNTWSPYLAQFLNSGYLQSPQYQRHLSETLGLSAVKLLEAVKQQTPCN